MDKSRTLKGKAVESRREVMRRWNEHYTTGDFGIGIQCDGCKKWRKVFQYRDGEKIPDDWYCSMWLIDGNEKGSCDIPSNYTEDDFLDYDPGALVWVKMHGYPWWPAMIEDCPDTQHYAIDYIDGESEYHVSFFGNKPLRSWIKVSKIKEFSKTAYDTSKKRTKYKASLKRAIEQANEAQKLPLKARLEKFSFAARYVGPWPKIKESDLVLLPSKDEEVKKSAESITLASGDKPHGSRDRCEISASKRKRENFELETASKRSMDDTEFQITGSQENAQTNKSEWFTDMDVSEDVKQQSLETANPSIMSQNYYSLKTSGQPSEKCARHPASTYKNENKNRARDEFRQQSSGSEDHYLTPVQEDYLKWLQKNLPSTTYKANIDALSNPKSDNVNCLSPLLKEYLNFLKKKYSWLTSDSVNSASKSNSVSNDSFEIDNQVRTMSAPSENDRVVNVETEATITRSGQASDYENPANSSESNSSVFVQYSEVASSFSAPLKTFNGTKVELYLLL